MTGILEHSRDLGRDVSPFKSSPNHHLVSPLPLITQDEVDNNDGIGGQQTAEVDYRFEAARLRSFDNWPVPYMDREKLAAAGFYYTGVDDKVKCFECHVEICQWEEGDDAMVDHQRWSGRCRFIRKIACGNVPIGVDPGTIPLPRPRSRDVCGPYGVEYCPRAAADQLHNSSDLQLPSTAKLGCLGIGRPKGPAHPEYASYDARLRTYESWPKSMPQTKEQLADAGFYYTGKGDQTLCYHCGGGLRDWEPEDDPWEQHAKWFSKCCYLIMVKGQEYVNKVTGQYISPPSKEEMMQMNLPSFIKKVVPLDTVENEKQKAENPGPSGSAGSQDSGYASSESIVEAFAESSAQEGMENFSSAKASGGSVVASGSCTTTTITTTTTSSSSSNSNSSGSGSKSVDDARMCKICYNGELGVVFLPCGHIVACVKCAPGMTTCAVCREPVTMVVRAFFS